MKGNIIISALLMLLSVIIGCSGDDSELQKLNYGTSYNMCLGYCRNELKAESGFVTYIHSSWQDTLETITCMEVLDKDTWEYLRSQLNFDDFFNLPNSIGCPDCADGGAEWIEIELVNGEKHKVTFEAGNEPEILKEYTEKLRRQMSKSGECGD